MYKLLAVAVCFGAMPSGAQGSLLLVVGGLCVVPGPEPGRGRRLGRHVKILALVPQTLLLAGLGSSRLGTLSSC